MNSTPFSPDVWQDIITSYSNGETKRSILRRLGIGERRLVSEFKKNGIKIKGRIEYPWIGTPKKYTDIQIEEIFQRYNNGESLYTTCAQMKLCYSPLKRFFELNRLDPKLHKITYDRPKTISGGGYLLVFVHPDHWLSPYSDKKGRMPEHRFIMATSLGRPLARKESVHHINGIVTDNRLENLQLRTSQHAGGIVARCACCGSKNIASVALSDGGQK